MLSHHSSSQENQNHSSDQEDSGHSPHEDSVTATSWVSAPATGEGITIWPSTFEWTPSAG
ncbi:MAG: hypothetical protein JWP09_409 [Candidatus Taylorbacteria bacterium]|nr:hypothetical protein [Candidatus Taylorbacteria bacterium]